MTDSIECHYVGELSLVYENFIAEVGKLGAVLTDPRTYQEAMGMPDPKQWEEVLPTEMKRLERFGVFSAPCELGQFSRRKFLRRKRLGAEGEAGGPGSFRSDADFFDNLVLCYLCSTCLLRAWVWMWPF